MGEILKVTKSDRKVLELLKKGKSADEISADLKLTKLDVQFSIIRLKRGDLYKDRDSKPRDKKTVKASGKPTDKKAKVGKISSQKSAKVGNIIETGVDKLLEIVEEKKNVTLKNIADELNLDGKIIEEWASILEEHDLIDMHYPIFGKPVLRIKGYKVPKKKGKKEKEKKEIKPSGPKKSKIPGFFILLIGFVVMFFYLGSIGRLPTLLNVYTQRVINFFRDLLIPLFGSQLYLEIALIIIIAIIIVVVIFMKFKGKIKLWLWKKRHI